MFVHAEAVGWKECKQTIHQGHERPVPRTNAEAEVPAIWMVGFRTTREEIREIYNEVYQLKKLPGPSPYWPEQMEALDQEICTSLEEQMWRRQGTTRLEEDLEGAPQASCSQTTRINPLALEATHLLEQNMERLSQAASKVKSARCQHSYSHSCSRMQSQGRHPWSSSPSSMRKYV